MARRTTMRGFSQCPWFVYWSAKASHAAGTMPEPSHVRLSQKSLVGRSGLTSSTAYVNDHSATPSIRRPNAVAPSVERRCHAASTSQTDTTMEVTSGNTYGVNCQCILAPPSHLIVQLFDRVPLQSAFFVGPDSVAERWRFAQQLLE